MKPTAKLRFVERDVPAYRGIRIVLQQWWESTSTMNLGFGGEMPLFEGKGEWRDVPTETEENT